MQTREEEARRCKVCGVRLIKKYKSIGRCSLHQLVKGSDLQLTEDAAEAKGRGLSYGEYMAAKREGRL